jgi:hypothetical protein
MGQKQVALVQFDNGYKNYSFRNDIQDLEVNDTVVVDTAQGYQLATVVGFQELTKVATKWVVQKVDLTAHVERLDKEKKKKLLKDKMEQRRKKLEEIEIYKALAKEDPEMAQLVEEFQGITV